MSNFLGSLEPHLAVVLATLTPFFGERAAVPLGLAVYKLSIPVTAGLVFIVSLLIPLLILPLLNYSTTWIQSRPGSFGKWLNNFLAQRHAHHSAQFARWGAAALTIIVAVPVPLAGVWTATLLAYIFGIRFRTAILAIALGAIGSIIIMTLITLGGRNLLG